MMPQASRGNLATIAEGDAGGRACPAKLKSKEKKNVAASFCISAPGGHGNSNAPAIRPHTSSLATIYGWPGGIAFFAMPARLTCTGAVADAAACGPTAISLYLVAGIVRGRFATA